MGGWCWLGGAVSFDDVVVGGGSAGCVIAARLSLDGSRRVLLVEAGPDYPALKDLPADIADSSQPSSSHDWGFASEPDDLGRSIPLPRGRLMGGCSATNAAFVVRGWPQDYDAWAAAGNAGWSFAEVLPVFCAMEQDADFDDEWHGSGGPLPVRRPSPNELSPLQLAFAQAALAVGHRRVRDHNRPGSVGVGAMPRNEQRGLRMSAAQTHLSPARARPNLTVRSAALVDRIELSGNQAVGVRLADGEVIHADRVVLAAGAYASPAVLLRSGIGPAADLNRHGIPQVAELPGVGANLIDHPLVAVDLPAAPGYSGPRFQTLLTVRSSRAAPDGPPDLHLFPAGPFDDPASPSGAVFGIVTGLLSPQSRGSVRLRSADPLDPPRIDIGHLHHPGDIERMVEVTRLARVIARTRPIADLILGPELRPGPEVSDDDEAGLSASIKARVGSYHHPVGTCAMGRAPTDGAVVDARGAVYGVDALWVADASVMPTIPAANTNLPTMMVAERIAGWLTE
jgi:choline dehydrogenase